MKILIDNGHGENTPGKRSPNGLFREYEYTREIAEAVVAGLRSRGYDAERIVRETVDVPLAERARRVNEECGKHGAGNVVLVSIHCNAAGNGDWMAARGWSAYTTKGKTKSDKLASCLYEAAEETLPNGIRIRKDLQDADEDWEENFYILSKTKCPAVLTENLFMDNREDVTFLASSEGKKAIIDLHIEGIIKYILE